MNILILARGIPKNKFLDNGLFEYQQANKIKSSDYKIIYVAFDFSLKSVIKNRLIGIKKQSEKDIDYYDIILPLSFLPLNIRFFFVNRIFKKILYEKKFKIDLIHAHFYVMGYYAKKIYNIYNINYIITEHSSNLIKLNKKNKNIIDYAYSKAKTIIAVSPYLKNIINKLGYKECMYIPNMINSRLFNIDKNKNEEDFEFICIGKLDYNKNISSVISAFIEFNKIVKNIKLKIVGDGPEFKKLKKMSKTNGSIEFFGYCKTETVAYHLKKSHCLISASYVETFGVVIVEALMCGIPVIASKSGGPNYIINESNGILLESNNIQNIVQAMKSIYLNYSKYCSKDIREHTIELYSESNIIIKIRNMYKEIIQKYD